MARKKPLKSVPVDAGKEYVKRIETCKIHRDVRICGKPEDVEKAWVLLEKQDIEQPPSCAKEREITHSITTSVEEDCEKVSDDSGCPLDATEVEQSMVEIPVDKDPDEGYCSCALRPGFGKRKRVTEAEET